MREIIDFARLVLKEMYLLLKMNSNFSWYALCQLLREKYFKPDWKIIISLHKFCSIMNLTNASSLFAISKFLVGAFDLRNVYFDT